MKAAINLSSIVDILTDLIVITNPGLDIVEANSAASSVLGKGGDILGGKCHEIFRDRFEPCQDCPLEEAIATGQVKSIQYFDKRFGEFFEERVQPVMDEQDDLSALIITNRNVTKIRETEERSSQEKKLAAIGKLSSGAAHDFNNVIAGVLGRVHLMRKNGVKGELEDHLASIEDAVKTGSATVRRMLEYAKGKSSREMENLDLQKLIDMVVFITQPKWMNLREEQGIMISLKTNIDNDLHIRGNKSELTNAFTNLVINAVDAMPDGGVIKLKANREDDLIQMKVSDTGTGMTQDILDRIFDPFFSTKGDKGTGLGLSEVFGTMKRHEAKIEVESEIGHGTTFKLEFKALDVEEVLVAKAEVSNIAELNILAVDDESYLLETLEDILEEDGHELQTFLDPLKALESLEQGATADIIFTDYEMPEMDGRAFAQSVRALRPDTPVILLSGWPIELKDDPELAEYVDLVLTKPFTLEDIHEAFHTLLAASKFGNRG